MEKTMLSNLFNKEKGMNLEHAKKELKSLLLNKGTRWGEGLRPDGKIHKRHFDTKEVLLDPRGAYLTTLLFLDRIMKYNPDFVGGLTMASHLIASSVVYASSMRGKNIGGFLVRKEQKKYSMLKLIEGVIEKNSNVIIVDDVIHASKFAIRAIEAVENLGCKVLGIVNLINYEKEDNGYLLEKGYNVENIFTLKELGLDSRLNPSKPEMFYLSWRYGIINVSDYTAPKSTPFINNNGIYIGSDKGKILAIDFNGNLLWEFETDSHPKGVHSSPIAVKGSVICSGYDGSVYALNEKDGSLIWKNKAADFIGASPVYDEDTNMIFIGLEYAYNKGALAALDFNTGKMAWESTTHEYVPGKAALGKEGVLVFGCNDYYLYALRKTDGKLLWKYRTFGETKGGKTIDEETNFAYSTSFDGHLYCLELKTGKLVWKRKLGTKLYNEPLIYNDKVIVGSFSNQVTALDKRTGHIHWYFTSKDSISSSPVEHEGIIYIGSNDYNIYALNAEEGTLLWNFKTDGNVTSSPRIFENNLYVSSNDGYLYCFKKR